jgi:hypothetical protein
LFDHRIFADARQEFRDLLPQLQQPAHDVRTHLFGARGFDRELGVSRLDDPPATALTDEQQIRVLQATFRGQGRDAGCSVQAIDADDV